MLRNEDVQRDTPAWIFQVWASFALSFGTTAVGIVYLPLDHHEARRLLNRLSEAKTEKIIREFEVGDTPSRAGA
jgi:hypothetical protein